MKKESEPPSPVLVDHAVDSILFSGASINVDLSFTNFNSLNS